MRTRRKMRMLSSVSMIIGTFLIFSGLLMALTGVTLAAGFTIVGDAEGLRVQTVGASWFEDVGNLNPGDTKESSVEIKNEGSEAFNVKMGLKRLDTPEGFDLLDKLIMTVTYRGAELHRGSMKEFPMLDLGSLLAGQVEEIGFVVEFPADTSNDYQGASATVQLVFEATKPDFVVPPEPPEGGSAALVLRKLVIDEAGNDITDQHEDVTFIVDVNGTEYELTPGTPYRIDDIEPGTYKVSEIKEMPDGYSYESGDGQYTVASGETKIVTITNRYTETEFEEVPEEPEGPGDEEEFEVEPEEPKGPDLPRTDGMGLLMLPMGFALLLFGLLLERRGREQKE